MKIDFIEDLRFSGCGMQETKNIRKESLLSLRIGADSSRLKPEDFSNR